MSLSQPFIHSVDTQPTNAFGNQYTHSIDAIPGNSISAQFSHTVFSGPSSSLGIGTDSPADFAPESIVGIGTDAYLSPANTFTGTSSGQLPVDEPTENYSGTTAEFAFLPPTNTFSGTSDGIFPFSPIRSFGSIALGAVAFSGLESPTNLAATVIDAGDVNLTWDDTVSGETGFRIQRSVSGQNDWSDIGTVDAGITSFQDRFATPLITFDYRVFSFDAQGDAVFPSNIDSATTPLPSSLSISSPPAVTTDPPRSTIKPSTTEILSPGIFGLEKDQNGNITGFKF